MSPLLQERATPAAAQPLPLGEEQQQLEREDSDSDSSTDSGDEVHVMSVCSGLGCPAVFPLLYCVWEGGWVSETVCALLVLVGVA